MEKVIVFSLFIHAAFAANPVFTVPGSPGRTVPVPETTPAGTSVYRVVAIDADSDVLVYSITSQRPTTPRKFSIVSSSGVISTMSEFDVDGPDAVKDYEISVRVTDGTSNIETTIVLEISDENDNSPVFKNYFVVRESTKPGTIVANIRAEDVDSGDNGKVTYRIAGGNIGGAFGIDSSSGLLYTMSSLEYDTRSTYILQVEARDSGAISRSSTMTLTLSLMESVGNGHEPVYISKLWWMLTVLLFTLFI